MPTLSQLKQISEVETRFTVSGEAQARQAMEGVANAQDKVARGGDAVATTTEKVEKRQLSLAGASEKLMRQLDQQYAAQQKFQAVNAQIERLASAGQYDANEAAHLQALAAARYTPKVSPTNDNHLGGGGLSSYDKMFIKYQGFDVASSLGSGANPMTVAFQQGPQVLQQLAGREGGLSAGLKQLGVTALGLVTPFTVAATAATALGAGFLYAATQASRDQEVLERATKGLGRGTGATTGDLDALAQANAAAGKVSVSGAREIAAGYASTGQIAIPVIGELTRMTTEYARITGQDAKTATTELATAFTDLSTGADAIASKIGGLDDRTRQLIQTQLEQGDRSGAQATAAEYLKGTIDANTNATTGWAAAWEKAANAANSYWEAAKKIAGIKLGVAPEGAQEALDRLNKELENTNKTRGALGMDPLGLGDSLVARRDVAAVEADRLAREAAGRAAEERASLASRTAGATARALDPVNAQYSDLLTKRNELAAAADDPLTRSKLADPYQVEMARDAYTRAIDSMLDANGKLYTSQDRLRQGDQLRLDAIKAHTDAEKAAVAERQKAFDLAGKPLTALDAGAQITRAGALSLAESAAKAGSGSRGDAKDEYDRALKSAEDRTRRMAEDAATYGMGAAAVARYRTETELLTAAQRAGRDITPELTRQMEDLATKAADAADKQEKLRDSMQDLDNLRSGGREFFGGMLRDLSHGKSLTDAFTSALSRLQDRMLDLASNQLMDTLFGKQGSSGMGLLGGSGSGGGLMSLLGLGGSGGGVQDLSESGLGTSAIWAANGRIPGYADGRAAMVSAAGIISGPGGPTSDSIPAWVSDREAIIRASAVDHYGSSFIKSINDRTFDPHRASAPRYAGGYVGMTQSDTAAAQSSGGSATGGAPVYNFIDQRPAGSPEQEHTMRPNGTGGLDVIIRHVEGRMGKRAADGQGPFKGALPGAAYRTG